MKIEKKHIVKTLGSTIDINRRPETIWENITNVKIEQFSDPTIFKLLDIPKPLKAEIISEDKAANELPILTAANDLCKKFWYGKLLTEYSFSFNPEKDFRVGYFFELSEGVFQIPTGAYYLTTVGQKTTLKLTTTYSIDKRLYFPIQYSC